MYILYLKNFQDICSYTQRAITQLLQGQLIFCHRLIDAGIKHKRLMLTLYQFYDLLHTADYYHVLSYTDS